MSDLQKLQFNNRTILTSSRDSFVAFNPGSKYIDLLPMTTFTWPSMSNGCFTVNNNVVTCYGVGGWKEVLYKTLTVETTGSYTLELYWTSSTGLTFWSGSSSQRQFGLWFDTSLDLTKNGDYQGAMAQGILMQDSNNTSVITKSQTATINLTAGTTYYIWFSYSVLADYRNQTIEFNRIRLVKPS